MNDEKNTQTNKTADTVPQQSQKKIKSSNEAVVSLATKPEGRIASFAWMVIAGDLVHIISDGLAIGAAFSDVGPYWFSSGVSTSIAVLCHEIPHELGEIVNRFVQIYTVFIMAPKPPSRGWTGFFF